MRGLYLITNDDPIQLLLEKLEGTSYWSYSYFAISSKKIEKINQPSEVELIKVLCEKYQVPFVINDDLALAEQFGLGVHLGSPMVKLLMRLSVYPKE
jgi:thiamine-phosphate pyrophosphorylase